MNFFWVAVSLITGIAVGYWSSGSKKSGVFSSGEKVGLSGKKIQAEEPAESIRISNEAVEITPERLRSLLAFRASLDMDIFKQTSWGETHRGFQKIVEWAGLDGIEREALRSILRQTAEDRLAWESANVKVSSRQAGEWSLEFPGDRGEARERLKQRLESTFSAEKVASISAAGDIDHFTSPSGTWAFKHGTVSVWIEDVGMISDGGAVEWVHFMTRNENSEGGRQLSVDRFEDDFYLSRYLRLIGTREELISAALKKKASEAKAKEAEEE